MKYGKIVKSFYGIVIVQEEDKHLNKFIRLKSSKHNNSVDKESACNAGDPSSIPRSRRSAGEGIGCLFQCSWTPLVAQSVKNPPTMCKTWVQFLGWEDPLEKGKVTHSSILA